MTSRLYQPYAYIIILLAMTFCCSLKALDGSSYDVIFDHVQKAIGTDVAGDRKKLMAESTVSFIESKVGGSPALILITPCYLDDNFSSAIPREIQNIYVYSPVAPYVHLATIVGREYCWKNQGGKIVIWGDYWNGREYKRTKYVFDGNKFIEAGSQVSEYRSQLLAD